MVDVDELQGGATPTAERGPLVAAARRLVPELRAAAAETDRSGVTRDQLELLAKAGLYGVDGPLSVGGAEASPAQAREVAELLAGADPQLWFVWFQHGPVVKMLAASENPAPARQWLRALCSGGAFAGVAYSHLRSARPGIRASRVADGYQLTGRQPWCTGWGLLDVILLGALTEEGEVLFAAVPARDGDGLRGGGEVPLAAMGSTHTVGLQLEDYVVPDEAVVLRAPYVEWHAIDRVGNANVQPSTFGVAFAAVDLLAEREPDVAAALRDALAGVRAVAYRLIDEVPVDEAIEERRTLRAQALLLCVQAATAAVVSSGGGAFALDHRGQQLLRAATFQLVHAQDAPIRGRTLELLVQAARPGG